MKESYLYIQVALVTQPPPPPADPPPWLLGGWSHLSQHEQHLHNSSSPGDTADSAAAALEDSRETDAAQAAANHKTPAGVDQGSNRGPSEVQASWMAFAAPGSSGRRSRVQTPPRFRLSGAGLASSGTGSKSKSLLQVRAGVFSRGVVP